MSTQPNINANRIEGSLSLSGDVIGNSFSGTTFYSGGTELSTLIKSTLYTKVTLTAVTSIALAFNLAIPHQANTDYRVILTPMNSTSVAYPFWMENKTTSQFDLRYSSPPGGSFIWFEATILP